MKRVYFKDLGQDLIQMDIMHIGEKHWEVMGGQLHFSANLWKGSYVNGDSIKVGGKIEIFNSDQKLASIKYPIERIEEVSDSIYDFGYTFACTSYGIAMIVFNSNTSNHERVANFTTKIKEGESDYVAYARLIARANRKLGTNF